MAFICSNLLSKTLTPKTLLIKLKTPKFAAPISSLIGPPELQNFGNLPKIERIDYCYYYDTEEELFSFNKTENPPPTPMSYTENFSPTYFPSGNPCLDFFFHIVPDTPFESVQKRLQEAWNHDSLTSLKLICNLRSVLGAGKSDKEGFYAAVLWLHEFHPKTLAFNVPSIAKFGYLKDLLEILYRILEGSDVRNIQKAERAKRQKQKSKHLQKMAEDMAAWEARIDWSYKFHAQTLPQTPWLWMGGEKNKSSGLNIFSSGWGCDFYRDRLKYKYLEYIEATHHMRFDMRVNPSPPSFSFWYKRHRKIDQNRSKAKGTRENRILEALEFIKKKKEIGSRNREVKRVTMAKKFLERYHNDSDFRLLYERVTDFFAESLKADMELLKNTETRNLSLAAKWCPSLYSSFDRSTLLCESIARKVFPRESYPEYQGVEEAHYAYRIRNRLKMEVLVPLRKALELPEVYIGQNKWGEIPYNRVAPVAMKFHKETFLRHDTERFCKYTVDLKTEKLWKRVESQGTLLPHQMIKSLYGGGHHHHYWPKMVDNLRREGNLRNSLAISDVSGSMRGTPMHVSIALGLLVSQLSEQPWSGKAITFSSNPTLQIVKYAKCVEVMEWEMNIDFQKVFDVILEVAVNGGLKEDEMIKRVFVFTDKEFDKACSRPWQNDYEAIVKKFTEKGYGNVIPEIVYWNLRDSKPKLVPSGHKGVTLMNGFSKKLMKLFLDGNVGIDPVPAMEAAISGEEYKKLAVFD